MQKQEVKKHQQIENLKLTELKLKKKASVNGLNKPLDAGIVDTIKKGNKHLDSDFQEKVTKFLGEKLEDAQEDHILASTGKLKISYEDIKGHYEEAIKEAQKLFDPEKSEDDKQEQLGLIKQLCEGELKDKEGPYTRLVRVFENALNEKSIQTYPETPTTPTKGSSSYNEYSALLQKKVLDVQSSTSSSDHVVNIPEDEGGDGKDKKTAKSEIEIKQGQLEEQKKKLEEEKKLLEQQEELNKEKEVLLEKKKNVEKKKNELEIKETTKSIEEKGIVETFREKYKEHKQALYVQKAKANLGRENVTYNQAKEALDPGEAKKQKQRATDLALKETLAPLQEKIKNATDATEISRITAELKMEMGILKTSLGERTKLGQEREHQELTEARERKDKEMGERWRIAQWFSDHNLAPARQATLTAFSAWSAAADAVSLAAQVIKWANGEH